MAEHASSFKPSLSLVDATMVVAGSMIGSGIFIVSSDITRHVGSAGWLIAVWLITGFMTITAAVSYGELSGMYPEAVANIVHVDLADGKRLTRRVDYPKGHAKNRLKDSEVEEKFFALVEPAIGKKRAKNIVDITWKLDQAKDVDELMQACVMKE